MVAFGVGEMLGSMLIGIIIDKKGNRAAIVTNLILIFTQTVFTLAFLTVNEYNWLAFIMAFLWGLQDSANNTHTSEMLGFEFDNNSEPYSIDNLMESCGTFVFEIIEAFLSSRRGYMIYIFTVGVLGLFMNSCTFLFDFKENHKEVAQFHNNSFLNA